MDWNVERDASIDPPIQTSNFLFLSVFILICAVDGNRVISYLFNLSAIPGSIVVPPLKTILESSYFLISILHFVMEL
jgi:hypothetical protein